MNSTVSYRTVAKKKVTTVTLSNDIPHITFYGSLDPKDAILKALQKAKNMCYGCGMDWYGISLCDHCISYIQPLSDERIKEINNLLDQSKLTPQ